jgi:AcrR family transcriptional regulator
MPTSPKPRNGEKARRDWNWKQTSQTRLRLLEAARDSFVELGFSRSSIADIVGRSGVSVGSLYHHFGGKAELFVSLFEDFDRRSTAMANNAIDTARSEGTTDPVALFIAGTRGYLRYTLDHVAETRLFAASSDVPPGFDILMNKDNRAWQRRTHALLADASTGGEVEDAMLPRVLIAIAIAGVRELISAEVATDPEHSQQVIEATVTFIRRAARPPA